MGEPDLASDQDLSATAPASLYSDPAVYASERLLVFARAWQFLGLEADLARPGDYIAETLAGFPVLALRTEGGLRAFHNVCRHRAGPLVGDARGRCAGELVCRYHGWRYALDGRLKAATGFGPADGFDPRAFSLFALRVETWRGLVFVNLDAEARPLMHTLAPLDRLLGDREIPPSVLRRSHAIASNWKVYVENYLEGYHIDVVHPGLAQEVDASRYCVRMEGDIAIHEVPSRGASAEGVWAWMWPNLAFNVYRGALVVEHMRPDGVGRTSLDYTYLHQPDDPALEASLATTERVTAEDAWICQRVQENLEAGVYQAGVLSPQREGAVAWFQRRVAAAMAG
jgi:choline monooxygenase